MARCPSEQSAGCQEEQTPTKDFLHVLLLRPALTNDQNSHFGYFFQLSPEMQHQTAPSLISCVGFELYAKEPSNNVPVLGNRLCTRKKMQAAAQPMGKEVSRA